MPTLSATKLFPLLFLSALALPCWAQELWVNEFHYDNAGSDTGEFVEIVVADSVATLSATTISTNSPVSLPALS